VPTPEPVLTTAPAADALPAVDTEQPTAAAADAVASSVAPLPFLDPIQIQSTNVQSGGANIVASSNAAVASPTHMHSANEEEAGSPVTTTNTANAREASMRSKRSTTTVPFVDTAEGSSRLRVPIPSFVQQQHLLLFPHSSSSALDIPSPLTRDGGNTTVTEEGSSRKNSGGEEATAAVLLANAHAVGVSGHGSGGALPAIESPPTTESAESAPLIAMVSGTNPLMPSCDVATPATEEEVVAAPPRPAVLGDTATLRGSGGAIDSGNEQQQLKVKANTLSPTEAVMGQQRHIAAAQLEAQQRRAVVEAFPAVGDHLPGHTAVQHVVASFPPLTALDLPFSTVTITVEPPPPSPPAAEVIIGDAQVGAQQPLKKRHATGDRRGSNGASSSVHQSGSVAEEEPPLLLASLSEANLQAHTRSSQRSSVVYSPTPPQLLGAAESGSNGAHQQRRASAGSRVNNGSNTAANAVNNRSASAYALLQHQSQHSQQNQNQNYQSSQPDCGGGGGGAPIVVQQAALNTTIVAVDYVPTRRESINQQHLYDHLDEAVRQMASGAPLIAPIHGGGEGASPAAEVGLDADGNTGGVVVALADGGGRRRRKRSSGEEVGASVVVDVSTPQATSSAQPPSGAGAGGMPMPNAQRCPIQLTIQPHLYSLGPSANPSPGNASCVISTTVVEPTITNGSPPSQHNHNNDIASSALNVFTTAVNVKQGAAAPLTLPTCTSFHSGMGMMRGIADGWTLEGGGGGNGGDSNNDNNTLHNHHDHYPSLFEIEPIPTSSAVAPIVNTAARAVGPRRSSSPSSSAAVTAAMLFSVSAGDCPRQMSQTARPAGVGAVTMPSNIQHSDANALAGPPFTIIDPVLLGSDAAGEKPVVVDAIASGATVITVIVADTDTAAASRDADDQTMMISTSSATALAAAAVGVATASEEKTRMIDGFTFGDVGLISSNPARAANNDGAPQQPSATATDEPLAAAASHHHEDRDDHQQRPSLVLLNSTIATTTSATATTLDSTVALNNIATTSAALTTMVAPHGMSGVTSEEDEAGPSSPIGMGTAIIGIVNSQGTFGSTMTGGTTATFTTTSSSNVNSNMITAVPAASAAATFVNGLIHTNDSAHHRLSGRGQVTMLALGRRITNRGARDSRRRHHNSSARWEAVAATHTLLLFMQQFGSRGYNKAIIGPWHLKTLAGDC